MKYWDTAALVKLYVEEPDSDYFETLLAETKEPILSSMIAVSELLCTLYRKERDGDIKVGDAKAALSRFTKGVESGVIRRIPHNVEVDAEAGRLAQLAYSQPKPVRIRALDLIHAASAVVGNADAFITTDLRLRQLVSLAGLKLFP